MQDRADPHAGEHIFEIARRDPLPGMAPAMRSRRKCYDRRDQRKFKYALGEFFPPPP